MSNTATPWYKTLNWYHWFVFIVCCLGWGLDCFDQQTFNIMRNKSLAALLHLDATNPIVMKMGGYATALMLIGWAVGGILFGIMGDKYGRAKTMIITIFVYAIFTGMSGLAVSWWDFFIYRFFCGMGVGGQFAAAVTLLSETMPENARTKTIGILAVVAVICNVMAGSLAAFCNYLDMTTEMFRSFPVWRTLFCVGFAPALLAFAVIRHLKEPQAWKDAIAAGGVKKAGSVPDLFKHPRWRYNVIVGMFLATCGVIGLWGLGFFSVDLTQMAFRNTKNAEARARGDVEKMDFELVRMLVENPKEFLPIARDKNISAFSLIGMNPKTSDPGTIYLIVNEIAKQAEQSLNTEIKCPDCGEIFTYNPLDSLTPKGVLTVYDSQTASELQKIRGESAKQRFEDKRKLERERLAEVLATSPKKSDKAEFEQLATDIAERAKKVGAYAGMWGGITSILFNFGAIFGTMGIAFAAERWGRRIAFTIFFVASFFMTIFVFLTMGAGKIFTPEWEVLIMQPVLGFCVLAIFGGYAIYFPELFPTRLRSTGVSFCYNIGRFASATGPAALGLLTAYVFVNMDEPIRWAGAVMSVTFILGIIFTWLGPETKGQPLPEE